jgi:hypothetical protein
MVLWLMENIEKIAALMSLVVILWAAIQYVLIKIAEAKKANFKAYHNIIKSLVEREDEDRPMRLDRQIALIYELRNFRKYFRVTRRILEGLKTDWAGYGPVDKRVRLMSEIDLSIKYIDKGMLGRLFSKT